MKVRPNVVGDPNVVPGGRSLAQWFNTAAFQVPAAYTFATAGRTFGEGPGAISVDSSLLKDFTVGNPDSRQGSPTYGKITSLVSGNQNRIIQLGVHLQF